MNLALIKLIVKVGRYYIRVSEVRNLLKIIVKTIYLHYHFTTY